MGTAKGFDTGPDGNVITQPLLGWTVAQVAGMTVLARLQYAETPADIGTEGRAVQLVMMPQQALDLAEVLTKQANRILGLPVPDKKN
jgi:hypothetical protein